MKVEWELIEGADEHDSKCDGCKEWVQNVERIDITRQGVTSEIIYLCRDCVMDMARTMTRAIDYNLFVE